MALITKRNFSLTIPFVVAPFQNGKVEESFEMEDQFGISQATWDHEVEKFKEQLFYKAERLCKQMRGLHEKLAY